jgi:hypothetical protein
MVSSCSCAFNRLYLSGYNQTCSDGNLSVFIKELLIRALTKSPGVSTSGLSFLWVTAVIHTLQFLQIPLTTISNRVTVKPFGSLMSGMPVSSRQTVLPHALHIK